MIGLWRIRYSDAPAASSRRIVFAPGLGDTPLSWWITLTLCSRSLRRNFDELVLLDFPGFHGFLASEKCFPSMDLLIAATNDVFRRLNPRAIIGHSLGAWLAAHYACASGEKARLEKVILCNSPGMYGDDEAREWDIWVGKFKTALDRGFDAFRELLFHKEPFWFRLFAGEFGGFLTREDTLEFLMSVKPSHGLKGKLAGVRSKVWLVWGEEDRLNPASWARSWLRELGDRGRAVAIPGAGHCIQSERPAAVAALISGILDGREPGEASRRLRLWKPIAS